MPFAVALGFALIAGVIIGLQPIMNGSIQAVIGTVRATFSSFAIGALLLLPVFLATSTGDQAPFFSHQPRWYYLAVPAAGVLVVAAGATTVRTLGGLGFTAVLLSGTVVSALFADAIGFAGLERAPVTWTRLAGIAFLAAGTALVFRR